MESIIEAWQGKAVRETPPEPIPEPDPAPEVELKRKAAQG
jgi:hypothetical protein